MKMFIDDNVIIPDEIKRMSTEELKKAIQELEQELKENRFHNYSTQYNPYEKTLFLHVEQRFFYM